MATIKFKEIKRKRKELKLSQEDLATKATINRSYVAKIEAGVFEPSIATLKRIAKALELDYKELLV
jgi:predicted transcriptional regulator